MGYLRTKIDAGKAFLIDSPVEDTVYTLDTKTNHIVQCTSEFTEKVLSNKSVKQMLAELSSGHLLEHLCVYANQPYILTSNSSGACLSSHDVVTPYELVADDKGGYSISSKVSTENENLVMPTRSIAKTDCVEVIVYPHQIPSELKASKQIPEGRAILIKRHQYPLVPSTIITTVRSAGLTITSPTINDNTRTMKAGDGHLMSSRKTMDDDMYFMHIPLSRAEMNSFDFKCEKAAKILISHLKQCQVDTKSNVILGNFYIDHDGNVKKRASTSSRPFFRSRSII